MFSAVEGSLATRKRASKSPSTTDVPPKRKHAGAHSLLSSDSEDQASPPSRRPRLLKGSNAQNGLETPSKSTSHAPATKARTSTRERVKVNYDMRYHPADKVLRPNSLHTKLAVELEVNHNHHENMTSCSDEEEDEEDGDDSTEGVMTPKPVKRVISQASPQSTRSGRSIKPANYNMKYHPMDAVLKPRSKLKQPAHTRNPSSALEAGKKSKEKDSRRGERVQNVCDYSSLFDSMGLSTPVEKSKKSISSNSDTIQHSVQRAGNKLFAEPVATCVADLSKFDHRLFFLAQGPHASWPHVVTKLIKEQLITGKELTDYGGIPSLKARFAEITTKVEEQLNVEHDASDIPDAQSESDDHRDHVENKHLKDLDVVKDAALSAGSTSIEDTSAESSNGRAVSTVPEADSISGADTLFNGASSIIQPFTEFMSEAEISDLLNEYRETSVDRRLGASPAPYAHPQQTDQVSSKTIELPMQPNSTPSHGQTEPRNPTKKRATSASAFAVHEDQPGTRPSVKKQMTRLPKSPGSDVPKENYEESDEAQSMLTENIGRSEVDLRNLAQSVEAHHRMQHGMLEFPDLFQTSFRLDVGSRLAPSPHIPMYGSRGIADRFAAVSTVAVEPAAGSTLIPFHYPTDPTRTFMIDRPRRPTASDFI